MNPLRWVSQSDFLLHQVSWGVVLLANCGNNRLTKKVHDIKIKSLANIHKVGYEVSIKLSYMQNCVQCIFHFLACGVLMIVNNVKRCVDTFAPGLVFIQNCWTFVYFVYFPSTLLLIKQEKLLFG